jgi:hypothetical protein
MLAHGGNNNLDCFIKQANIFIEKKKQYRLFIMHFFNFQALLNHRANACSCSFFKRTGVLSFLIPVLRTKFHTKISYKIL